MNPQLSYASQSASDSPEPAPQNFFSRLTGVFFSPGEAFQEIGRAPRLAAPIIAMALLSLIVSAVAFSRIPWERANEQRIEQMVIDGKITPEQAEQQREGMKKLGPIFKFVGPPLAAVWSVLLALAIAGVAKMVSAMTGVENDFKPVFAVTLYSFLVIAIVSSVVFVLLLFIKPADEFDLSNPIGSNLAAALTMAGVSGISGFLKGLLSYVDVFYIWRVILLAIGYAAVSRKLKTSTAMLYTGVVALIVAIVGAAWGAMFGM
jgi:preprotein translocase subunit SecG